MSQTPTSTGGGRSRLRRLSWLVPALTFVAGLLLGGGVIAAADWGGGDRPAAAQAQSVPPPNPIPSGDATITVPASCAEGLDRAEAALDAADTALEAVRDLDTAQLQRALDRLQGIQPDVRRLADACRAAATDGG
jgi:hypothetical protein